jgi:hypothetical protein
MIFPEGRLSHQLRDVYVFLLTLHTTYNFSLVVCKVLSEMKLAERVNYHNAVLIVTPAKAGVYDCMDAGGRATQEIKPSQTTRFPLPARRPAQASRE